MNKIFEIPGRESNETEISERSLENLVAAPEALSTWYRFLPSFLYSFLPSFLPYRPNSVILVMAKVFDGVIYDQLYHYLITNNLLSSLNQVFRLTSLVTLPALMAQGGYSEFQVMGMIEWGQKSKLPQNTLGFQQNPKKSLDQKLTLQKSLAEFPSLNF